MIRRKTCLSCQQPLGYSWLFCSDHWARVPEPLTRLVIQRYGQYVRSAPDPGAVSRSEMARLVAYLAAVATAKAFAELHLKNPFPTVTSTNPVTSETQ